MSARIKILRTLPLRNFSLDHQKFILVVRAFYAVLIIANVLEFLPRVSRGSVAGADWLWPVGWLNHLTNDVALLSIRALCGLAFLVHALTVIKWESRWLRLASFAVLFQLMAACYSFGKISHNSHALLFTSFFFIFLRLEAKASAVSSAKNKFFFWAAQTAFLGTYFLSGVWKATYLIHDIINKGWGETNTLLVSVARSRLENFERLGWERALFDHPEFFRMAFVLVTITEIACLYAVWNPRHQRAWGAIVIGLHIGGSILFQAHFFPAILLSAILLVGHPYRVRAASV